MRAGETGTQPFWFYFRRSFLDGHPDERHDRAEAIEDRVLSLHRHAAARADLCARRSRAAQPNDSSTSRDDVISAYSHDFKSAPSPPVTHAEPLAEAHSKESIVHTASM